MSQTHPLMVPKTKEELSQEVAKLKKAADFWRNHWIAFYIVVGWTVYKAYTGWRTSRALTRLVNYVESKPEIMAAKNPKRKRRK